MGFFKLLKTNLGTIKRQREIERAMSLSDKIKAKRLIGESINEILTAGLTTKQLSTFKKINRENGNLLNKLLSEAFQRGWERSSKPNLSNALDEVLRVAQEAVKEYQNTFSQ
jgi:hypothetical protein